MVIKELFQRLIKYIKRLIESMSKKFKKPKTGSDGTFIGMPERALADELKLEDDIVSYSQPEEPVHLDDDAVITPHVVEHDLADTEVIPEENTITEEPTMNPYNENQPTTVEEAVTPGQCTLCDRTRNETEYTAPCAIGDYVYRTVRQTDDNGNVSWKTTKGQVVAIEINAECHIWLKVNFGVNVPVLNLPAEEYDYNTAEVGARILALQK